MATKPVRIAIIANAAQAKKELGEISRESGSLGGKFKKFGAVAAAGVAVAGAATVAFAAQSVKSASDAQQSLGATQTVYGKYADTVISRSKEAARAIGVSANEYRELSNVTGALLNGAGMPLKKVADLTGDLNTRAADMAATFGGTTREAVEAISSLMKGEADPIEKYGISIKQTDVNARLAAQGQDKLTGSAKKQAEMQARVELLMSKSSRTAGAFAKESNTLANQTQVLGAQWEDLKAKAGAVLLPVLTALAAFVNNTLFPAIERMAGPAKELATEFGERLRPAVALVMEAVGRFQPIVQAIADTFTTTVMPAIIALAGYFTAKLFPVFMQIAAIVSETVIPVLTEIYTWLYGSLIPSIVAVVAVVAQRLKPVFEALVTTFSTQVLPAVQLILEKFREWLPTIKRVIGVVVAFVGALLTTAAAILAKVLPPVLKLAGWLLSKLVPAVLGVIGIVIKVIGWIVSFGVGLVNAAKKAADFATRVVSAVKEIPGKVLEVIDGLKDSMYNAGKELLSKLGDGIRAGIEKAADAMKAAANKLKGFLPGSPVRYGPLTSWNNGGAGRRLMGLLADGIEPTQPIRALRAVASALDAEAARGSLSVGLARSSSPASSGAGVTQLMLSAEQLHSLERGRRVALDLRPYLAAGGAL